MYHDLYVHCDTLMLADVFENFRDKCIEIYELDPTHFLSAPGLAWQACFKKTCQKLPVNGFKWVKYLSESNSIQFNESFIRDYNENSDVEYFLEVDIDYPEKLFNLHKDLPFLPERKKVNKVEKLICSIEDKEKHLIHIRALKQVLNHGLVLGKVHRVIQFNQEDWLKPCTDMNTK